MDRKCYEAAMKFAAEWIEEAKKLNDPTLNAVANAAAATWQSAAMVCHRIDLLERTLTKLVSDKKEAA